MLSWRHHWVGACTAATFMISSSGFRSEQARRLAGDFLKLILTGIYWEEPGVPLLNYTSASTSCILSQRSNEVDGKCMEK